jgi:hypothetical protein
MSCCIAAIASGGSHIVLVADKTAGSSTLRGEPNGLLKLAQVHEAWWALFAGDASLAGDLFARLRRAMPPGPLSAEVAEAFLSTAMFEKWVSDTERRFLTPEGYDTESFRAEAPRRMRPGIYERVRTLRLAYVLDAALLLTGFDADGHPHILSCTGFDDAVHTKHVPANHDVEGYFGVGAGAPGALWMMKYKDVVPAMPFRDVAYYAVEGKYFGELRPGVAATTELVVLRCRRKTLYLDTRWIDTVFIPISAKLRPRTLKKKNRKKLRKVEYEKG